jgi:L-methionine (R)-S-oxide reductase
MTPVDEWLQTFLTAHGGTSGTVHLHRDGALHLAAAENIPPPVQQVVAVIPKGKGMAGLAWEQNRPIQTCNLKEDNTGSVKPGAKAVNAKAAVALPVNHADGSIRAVVGIAFPDERQFTDEDLDRLLRGAGTLPGPD